MPDLQLGLHTFGDVTLDAAGVLLPQAQVIRNVVAEAVLAEQVGLDFFGVGEHHREDFAVSAPEVVLAAIAGQTSRIRLGSAVTVLSSDDPVRVFERFSTLDAVSGGRAEVILGRGSFTESFPLFGFALDQYELLFEEKLELFAELLQGGARHLVGGTRAALHEQRVYPPTASGACARGSRVGGTPAVGGARRALRPAADAGDHRRRADARSRPSSTCTSARSRSSGRRRRCRSASTRPATSRARTSRRSRRAGRTTR